jgi:hypothetical protein
MAHFLDTVFMVLLVFVTTARADTPAAATPRRVRDDLRAAGWKRVVVVALYAAAGVLALAVLSLLREGLYGAALAVAALACAVASVVALDGRPVRVRRLWVRA